MSGLGKNKYLLWLKASVFLLILTVQNVSGQRYFTRTYTESDGLANSMVFGVVQDSAGIMWFSTRMGISSYDGSTFRNYFFSDGLPIAAYGPMLLDEKNKIWAHPQRGKLAPCYFDGKRWVQWNHQTDPSPTNTFTAFSVDYRDDSAIVYLGTVDDGLFVSDGHRWKNFRFTKSKELRNHIKDLAWYNGALLSATANGLFRFTGDRLEEAGDMNRQLPFPEIQALYSDNKSRNLSDNRLYILGRSYLGYFEDGKFVRICDNFTILPTDVSNHCLIYPDGNGNYYFGNDFYLFYYEGSTGHIRSLDRNSGLFSEGATSILIDREGNTWFTGRRGVTVIPSRRFITYNQINGLADNEVASGIEMSPGHYVFGHHGVLTFTDGRDFSYLYLTDRDNWDHGSRVLDMAKDQQGNLWIAATELGLAKLSPNGHLKWICQNRKPDERINSVVSLRDGRIFASGSAGVYEIRNDRFFPAPFKLFNGPGIRKLFAGPGDDLILATINTGIVRIRENKEIHYKPETIGNQESVFSYIAMKNGTEYAGTAGGLYLTGKSGMSMARLGTNILTRPVYALLEDDLNRLWIGTDNGIYRWDGKRLEHFSTRDGISGQEINRGACFKDTYGRILFGTNNGVTVFRPQYDYNIQSIPPPRITLESMISGSDSVAAGQKIVLSSGKSNLIIRFRVLSFIDEKQIYYKYKLEGFDDDWSEDHYYHDRQISFNTLPPGKYRLAVKACNALGIWSEPVYTGLIFVKPPIFFRWWFIIIFILLLSGIVFFIARMVTVARYNVRLEEVVSERTAELVESEKKLTQSNASKDNFFSIIAHDLKSPFNAILGMLELLNTAYEDYSDQERKKMLASVRSASVRTIALLENLLTWAQSQKGILPFEPVLFPVGEVIDENIKLIEPAAVSKNIRLVKTGDAHVHVCADRNMVRTVIRNLISNAVKFTYPGGLVTISFTNADAFTTKIAVSDNGQGISPENLKRLFRIDDRMANKGTNNETGTGLGLILCQEFVEKNHGKITVESKVAEGSVFTVTLPSSCG